VPGIPESKKGGDRMKNGKVYIWLQLLGFDRDAPDHGAAGYLDRLGFTPAGLCALLYHPDFVHLHRGMDEEYPLFPDNCSYYAVPKNRERARQPWTNYDLRGLNAALKARSVGMWMGIMGPYLEDMFHKEWLTDHQELRSTERHKIGWLHCLKRLKDGSWYEDFFIDKLCQALVDYDFEGVHIADGFCPNGNRYICDWSSDMLGQFLDDTGLTLPEDVTATLGHEDEAAVNLRADYVWEHLREEWLRFYMRRWERFFRKLCGRVHALGKKVAFLGMYCTDPFETMMIYGFDTDAVMRAGADMITANVLPTSVALNNPKREYFFHRYHMITPLLSAQVNGAGEVVSMLGVQDATEEWDVLHHAPCKFERDLYTMTMARRISDGAMKPALDGLFLCLGDGIMRESWDFMRERFEAAFSNNAVRSLSPAVLWSDTANSAMITAYIATRRTSVHKQAFELFKRGYPLPTAVRVEDLAGYTGPLFVPNFDLLPEDERKTVAAYRGVLVGTVPAGFDLTPYVTPSAEVTDVYSDYPLTAFLVNGVVSEAALTFSDDGKPSHAGEDDNVYPLNRELPFTKLTDGFLCAIGAMLTADCPYTCTQPFATFTLPDRDRLYIFNSYENHYHYAVITAPKATARVVPVSLFPVQSPRYVSDLNVSFAFDYDRENPTRKFQTKLQPAGMTILDVFY